MSRRPPLGSDTPSAAAAACDDEGDAARQGRLAAVCTELAAAVAERDEARSELASRVETTERLFAILAHDLRGPLGSMRQLTSMTLEDGDVDPDRARELMRAFGLSIDAAYDLLENLLGWVRSQMREIAVLRDRVGLRACLSRVVAWLAGSAAAKGITLRVEPGDEVYVFADERMLEAVARNLLSNAIKFSPSGTAVELGAWCMNESAALYVRDRGRGIEPDELARLFSMADRKITLGTAGERGSGMGLSFSQQLAARMGGRIEAESRIGEGSAFTLYLPAEVEGELPCA